ncbi:unnamed protein product [Sphagnum jensenii]|uniref:Uncharacterized protein n=1 Tax=Sphagnum jensenii TaxID=128206 RepID=A0ABP0VAR0_9BRYO
MHSFCKSGAYEVFMENGKCGKDSAIAYRHGLLQQLGRLLIGAQLTSKGSDGNLIECGFIQSFKPLAAADLTVSKSRLMPLRLLFWGRY